MLVKFVMLGNKVKRYRMKKGSTVLDLFKKYNIITVNNIVRLNGSDCWGGSILTHNSVVIIIPRIISK